VPGMVLLEWSNWVSGQELGSWTLTVGLVVDSSIDPYRQCFLCARSRRDNLRDSIRLHARAHHDIVYGSTVCLTI